MNNPKPRYLKYKDYLIISAHWERIYSDFQNQTKDFILKFGDNIISCDGYDSIFLSYNLPVAGITDSEISFLKHSRTYNIQQILEI